MSTFEKVARFVFMLIFLFIYMAVLVLLYDVPSLVATLLAFAIIIAFSFLSKLTPRF